jgi:hypothetical protein
MNARGSGESGATVFALCPATTKAGLNWTIRFSDTRQAARELSLEHPDTVCAVEYKISSKDRPQRGNPKKTIRWPKNVTLKIGDNLHRFSVNC